jgi:hypothetical protein
LILLSNHDKINVQQEQQVFLAKQRERNLASSSMSAARKEAPMKEKEHLESADSPSPRWGLAVWVFPTHTAHPRNTTLNKFIHVAIITPASSRFFKVEKKYLLAGVIKASPTCLSPQIRLMKPEGRSKQPKSKTLKPSRRTQSE